MNFDKLINSLLKEDGELSRQERIDLLKKHAKLLTPVSVSFDWSIKSFGYQAEEQQIIDDTDWSGEWDYYWDEGEEVSFENGLEQLKQYVLDHNGGEHWDDMQAMLQGIRAEVRDLGTWKLWGVERDWSLGVQVDY